MRILILGAGGMLGHRLFLELSKHHEVYGTAKGGWYKQFLPHERIFQFGVDSVVTSESLARAFSEAKPDVVINCIAVIRPQEYLPMTTIKVNSWFPHELMCVTSEHDARLIHFSTDGVFSGKRGNYTEDDTPDATDVYGMTKRLGEIADKSHVLTLRCCPIGREIGAKKSLVEWFLAQTGTVRGYTNAWFNPLTTHEIAIMLNEYVLPNPELHGLYHVGGSVWQKAVFLHRLNDIYKRDVEIIPDDSVTCNRTLRTQRFNSETGYKPHDLSEMLEMMRAENVIYEGEHAHG
jgi:dTDP-4-dehydrorhamnose reductase